jgi:hypothetical protein
MKPPPAAPPTPGVRPLNKFILFLRNLKAAPKGREMRFLPANLVTNPANLNSPISARLRPPLINTNSAATCANSPTILSVISFNFSLFPCARALMN